MVQKIIPLDPDTQYIAFYLKKPICRVHRSEKEKKKCCNVLHPHIDVFQYVSLFPFILILFFQLHRPDQRVIGFSVDRRNQKRPSFVRFAYQSYCSTIDRYLSVYICNCAPLLTSEKLSNKPRKIDTQKEREKANICRLCRAFNLF